MKALFVVKIPVLKIFLNNIFKFYGFFVFLVEEKSEEHSKKKKKSTLTIRYSVGV